MGYGCHFKNHNIMITSLLRCGFYGFLGSLKWCHGVSNHRPLHFFFKSKSDWQNKNSESPNYWSFVQAIRLVAKAVYPHKWTVMRKLFLCLWRYHVTVIRLCRQPLVVQENSTFYTASGEYHRECLFDSTFISKLCRIRYKITYVLL